MPGPALTAVSIESQLGFTWESPIPAQVAAISDCFIAHAGWPQAKHSWGLTLACTTDPPQRAEVGGQWSWPILEADWPG